MHRKDIIEYLKYYITCEGIDYAIMIDGKWGTGKTFFVNKDLKEIVDTLNIENEEKYQLISISLFGLNNIEEIEEKLFTGILTNKSRFDEDKVEITKEITKSSTAILKGVLDIFSAGAVVDATSGLANKLATKLILDKNIDKKTIIVFDDLERTNVDIISLLGYINQFVEQYNSKIIFVANQSELFKLNADKNYELKLLVASNIIQDKINESSKNDEVQIISLLDKE